MVWYDEWAKCQGLETQPIQSIAMLCLVSRLSSQHRKSFEVSSAQCYVVAVKSIGVFLMFTTFNLQHKLFMCFSEILFDCPIQSITYWKRKAI